MVIIKIGQRPSKCIGNHVFFIKLDGQLQKQQIRIPLDNPLPEFYGYGVKIIILNS